MPADHPLRWIRDPGDGGYGAAGAVTELQSDVCELRTSVDCAREVTASLLLQVLYSIRSERLLMEQLEYNLLFRWFVGLNMDEPVWVATVFSKNPGQLLAGDIAQKFFSQILEQAREANLTSDEHFSVDGTLIEAWASQKSFQRKDQPKQPPPRRSR